MKKTLAQLKQILGKKEQSQIVGLIFMMFIGGLLELVGVAGVFPIISAITGNDIAGGVSIIIMCILLIGVYILKNMYLAFMYKTIFAFVYKGRSRLAIRMFDIYMKEPYDFHLNRNVAIIQRTVRSDVDGCYAVVKAILSIASEGVIAIILCGLLVFTDPVMALFLMVLLVVCVGIVFIVSKRTVKKLGQQDIEHAGEMNKWLMQGIGGIKEIRLLRRENFFTEHFAVHSKKSSECNQKQQIISLLPRMFTETVCIAGVMLWIIIATLRGDDLMSTIPTLAVFAVAAFRLLPSVGKINGYLAEYQFFRPRVDSIYNDLTSFGDRLHLNSDDYEKLSDDNGYQPVTIEKDIDITGLSFGYTGTDKMIFENANLNIKKGESVGIIGPSGAGKTTFVDVLMGLLPYSSGNIKVDGKSVSDNQEGWSRCIGYVPQTIYLSDDTIRNNIAFGLSENDINDEKINQVIKQAQLKEFIDSLPDGVRTVVGDRGVRLSGGQRQRIGVARALYSNPELLVLDEATSALDNDTEGAVMEAIDSLHGHITMVIIAHRLSTIEGCDSVYRIENGSMKRDR